jgi:hypothetical protein
VLQADNPQEQARARPEARQIRSWQDAEHNAAAWMRCWGFGDAAAQPGGSDGGVDVRASGALAQVKFKAVMVGRPELQRLVGARGLDHNARLLFFSGTDYAATAVEYADHMGIALFQYALDGAVQPINSAARHLVATAAPHPQVPSHSPPMTGWMPPPQKQSTLGPFVARNWRLILGVVLLIAPFGSLGDPEVYTGPFPLDALKFLGILVGAWLVGICLIAWHAVGSSRE